MMLYAMHDAMVKAMPATRWRRASPNPGHGSGRAELRFVLRRACKFHNGEPVTAEDVKFSLERYRGSSSKTMKERVAGVRRPIRTG